ncbi:hypothetical protein B0H19DRAFT_1063022 [Mycena capillaripes]|nr:hypothetical protein B0H19DRAFT_1063022 [Mycena capillaripes]
MPLKDMKCWVGVVGIGGGKSVLAAVRQKLGRNPTPCGCTPRSAQMISLTKFPSVSAFISDNAANSTRWLSAIPRTRSLREWLRIVDRNLPKDPSFQKFMEIAATLDSEFLDDISVIQGSANNILFAKAFKVMDLSRARRHSTLQCQVSDTARGASLDQWAFLAMGGPIPRIAQMLTQMMSCPI